MGRRGERTNRQRRRRETTGAQMDIEFPGFMGFLQRRMKSFFIAGIILLVASLGVPIITSLLNNSAETQSELAQNSEATAVATIDNVTQVTTAIQRSYSSEPEFQLVDSKTYEAIILLEEGDREIRIELLHEESPIYVNNFVFLARQRFYDGLTFHRVIEGFVAQGGDPTGTGMTGSGYILTEEFNEIKLDSEGLLSMAKNSQGVSGSQFFITLGETPWLTGDFTVFGRVVEGMDIVHSIRAREPETGQPLAEVIKNISIVEK